MSYLERASKSIDHLQSIVGRLNEEAARVDGPASALEISKEVGPNGVPIEFTATAREAIEALLEALASADRGVYDMVAGGPPEWWRNLRAILGDKRTEDATPQPPLLDAFNILDRHVSEDNAIIGGLAFLVERLDHKIMRGGAGAHFRAAGDPYSDGISFSFDPQIDNKIDPPLRKLLGEISGLPKAVLPQECVPFLRQALDEACEIIG